MMPTTGLNNLVCAIAIALVTIPGGAGAQHAHEHGTAVKNPASARTAEIDSSVTAGTDHVMNGTMVPGLHMAMTPSRPKTREDSIRAAAIVSELRTSIAKYRDVQVAVKDGYRQFAPGLKGQKVLHFTNYRSAVRSSFRFDPARPTSLLYKPVEGGQPILVGAMYTAPKRASLEDLDKRVPLGVAKWHKHTNFCVPPRGQKERWKEIRDGLPVFGPLSPIATEEECDRVGGRFHPEVFGWMVHANVFEGDDPSVIWGDELGARHEH